MALSENPLQDFNGSPVVLRSHVVRALLRDQDVVRVVLDDGRALETLQNRASLRSSAIVLHPQYPIAALEPRRRAGTQTPPASRGTPPGPLTPRAQTSAWPSHRPLTLSACAHPESSGPRSRVHRPHAHAAIALVAAAVRDHDLAGALTAPAKSEPIITLDAPAAMALGMSPLCRTPPSAITGISSPASARACAVTCIIAVIWKVPPTPVTTRVVQDGARADAHLDRIAARFDEVAGRFACSDVARDDLDAARLHCRMLLERLDRPQHVLAVPVRRPPPAHPPRPRSARLPPGHSARSPPPPPAPPHRSRPRESGARLGIAAQPLDVPHRDQAGQPPLVVHQ